MSQAVGLFLFVGFLRSSCQKELKGVLPNIETKYTQCLLNLRVRLSRHCYKVLKEKLMILNKSRNLYFVTDCKIKNSSENFLLFITKKYCIRNHRVSVLFCSVQRTDCWHSWVILLSGRLMPLIKSSDVQVP